MQAPVEIGVRPRAVLAYAAARVMTEEQLTHGSSGLLGWYLLHFQHLVDDFPLLLWVFWGYLDTDANG